ncbi:hypothetical protein HID58_084319 [Brassica napus]|uniref:pectinesterase n=1 Tax=Brassica napus TaxID=3708 RepID=A0ABQ7XJB4_BRANA|nr:hypothetical protein HID58_084319 [Brassica napus]
MVMRRKMSLERMATSRTVTVAQDGSGDYCSVQDAVDSVPIGNTCRTVICLSPGIYRQPVYVAKKKNFITLAGIFPETTVLTWNNTASKNEHHQEARVIGKGTFASGTVIVEGDDFIAENITFENSSPQGSGQAVAVRVSADRCAFYNCRFLSWQGSVDFIFGNSTALLEHCHIHCKSPGYITAQSRKSPQESTGYVFLRCVITGNGESGYMYLGRPWRPFGRVVFAYTYMDACIRNVGWHNWGNEDNEESACFYEYRCFGPGSCLSERVTWWRELMDEEVGQFLHYCFVDPDQDRPWLCPRTGGRTPCSA